MFEFLRVIAALALMLLAIVPVLSSGGQLIAAFMTRQQIPRHLLFCVIAMLALLCGALLAAFFMRNSSPVWAALALAAVPWGAHGFALWWSRRKASTSVASS
jgi:hypothetical protein